MFENAERLRKSWIPWGGSPYMPRTRYTHELTDAEWQFIVPIPTPVLINRHNYPQYTS